MKLHTGNLLWHDSLPNPPQYAPLRDNITCDVLVVGGGEAGSLTAYHLVEAGVDTVLIDRREIGHGSTSANTGLLQFSNDKMLQSCMNTFGEMNGLRFYQLCQKAIDDLETVTAKLDIFPDFFRRDSLYFASTEADVPSLRNEYELLQKHGFPVTFMEGDEIARTFSFRKAAAIYSKNEAEINPYKLANALVHQAHQKGLRVFTQTEIKRRETKPDHLVFHTANQQTITCKKAVICMGYETQALHSNSNAALSSSYAVATQPIADYVGYPNRVLIWETARPYLYIRTTADNRLLIGGLDEVSPKPEHRDAHLLQKTKLLVERAQELFPQIPDLRSEYAWSGTFGETHDGVPLIGEQPGFPHCYFLLGYGGNGTVYSMIGAEIIRDLIVKGNHADAHLFAFERKQRSFVVT